MGQNWPWYARASLGACRLTAVAVGAEVRRAVRIASQAVAEHRSAVVRPGRDQIPGLHCPLPLRPPAPDSGDMIPGTVTAAGEGFR